MPDPRFFAARGPLSVAVLAKRGGASLDRDADGSKLIASVASATDADRDALAYCVSRSQLRDLAATAGACVTTPVLASEVPAETVCLTADDPRLAFARMADALYPAALPSPAVSADARVAVDAVVAPSCRIEAGAVIGSCAELGKGAWIGHNATIGPGVILGARTRVDANATIVCAVIGADVHVHAGARIGQAGFGFVWSDAEKGYKRVPQLGRVCIGDRADIGANACIDRGSLGDTVVGEGALLDNLVHVAHNVQVGPHAVLAGQTGIGGSSSVGAFSLIGGQAGISDHLEVGRHCQIGAQAGVVRDLADGSKVAGSPAVPVRRYLRQAVVLGRLAAGRRQPVGGSGS